MSHARASVRVLAGAVLALAGCGQATPGVLTVDLRGPVDPYDLGVGAPVDDDGDGLDDRAELLLARDYLPYISTAPTDKCSLGGLLVRVRPHPKDATLIHVIYDYLYDADCGLAGHAGDDEVFAATIDPTRPAPDGIIALRAISHQGTPCQRVSECGRCGGLTACETRPLGGVAWPAIWPSRDKHGSYVNRSVTCTLATTCLDECLDAAGPMIPPIVNAGEPGHPLVHDLTDNGFITAANGWTNQPLFHFDPWKAGKFGGAGDVSLDLVDTAFDTVACRP